MTACESGRADFFDVLLRYRVVGVTPSAIAQSARTHSDVFFAGASDGEPTERSVLQNAWVVGEQ